MALVPTLDRLNRADVADRDNPIRQMAIWQEMCEGIEGAFGEIVELLLTVATKNGVYIQATAPTGASVNDLWFDSDDGYKPYSWDGAAWVTVQDVGAAYARVGINPDGTIADDKVVNASVMAGAVLTTPGSSITSSTTLAAASTWYDCGSVTATLSGVPTTISVDFDTEIIDNCKISYRLRNGSTTMGRERGPISVNTADEPGYSITRQHTPTAGSNTYTIQALVNDAGDAIIHDPVFTITENRNL
jgi:hypothetical protein